MAFVSLKGKSQFTRVFAEGRKFISKFFVGYLLKSPQVDIARCGVIATKKAFPQAVTRTYVKRILRNITRSILPDGYDLIIIVRQPILEESYKHLLKECKDKLCWVISKE